MHDMLQMFADWCSVIVHCTVCVSIWSVLIMYVQYVQLHACLCYVICTCWCVSFITSCCSVSKLKRVGHLPSSEYSGLLTFLNSNGPWSSEARHKVEQHTLCPVHCQLSVRNTTTLLTHLSWILNRRKHLFFQFIWKWCLNQWLQIVSQMCQFNVFTAQESHNISFKSSVSYPS